jgi:hypothetical protein
MDIWVVEEARQFVVLLVQHFEGVDAARTTTYVKKDFHGLGFKGPRGQEPK